MNESAMQLGIGPHLDESDLEKYSMGTLPEARLAPFEEHFLACDSCQDRLLEMETYVNAVRSVSPRLREAKTVQWHELLFRPGMAWASAAVLGMAVLSVGRLWIPERHELPPVTVFLHSSRGIDGLAVATAPAGKPLSLSMDLAELPAFPAYRLEIVNSTGKPLWQTTAVPQDSKITQRLGKVLSADQYYVRLFGPRGELLREFGLRVH
jgi:hypothetical protein